MVIRAGMMLLGIYEMECYWVYMRWNDIGYGMEWHWVWDRMVLSMDGDGIGYEWELGLVWDNIGYPWGGDIVSAIASASDTE